MNKKTETNLIVAMLDTVINWQIAVGHHKRVHLLCDARQFNTGALSGDIDPEGRIVLNIAGPAVKGFQYGDDGLSYTCGKNGEPVFISLPYAAILGWLAPFGENTCFMPLPNMHRLEHELAEITGVLASQIEAEPYAVHEPEAPQPTLEEIHALRSVPKGVPPLDAGFSHYPDTRVTQPKSRYVGKPKLTVIKGGKA